MGRFGGIATPSGVGCWSIASSPPPAIRHVSLKICWYLDTITQKVNKKYIRGRNVIYVNCNLLWIQSICSWKFIQPVIINRLSNINRIFHLKEKGGNYLKFYSCTVAVSSSKFLSYTTTLFSSKFRVLSFIGGKKFSPKKAINDRCFKPPLQPVCA